MHAFRTPTGIPRGTINLRSRRAYNPSWAGGASGGGPPPPFPPIRPLAVPMLWSCRRHNLQNAVECTLRDSP